MKKDIIRVGDLVKVTNPEKFIRCGYPLNTEAVIRSMDSSIVPKIDELLGGKPPNTIKLFDDVAPAKYTVEYDNAFDSIVRAIAKYQLYKKSWGGNTRSIYTEKDDSLTDKLYRVAHKFVVKTGNRVQGYSTQGYYDPYPEYTPTSFAVSGTHVILLIERNYPYDGFVHCKEDVIKIEAKNVQKVYEPWVKS